MVILTKRVYEPAGEGGIRILVDRIWPRGFKKMDLHGLWIKEVAPSDSLRKWYNHDPDKWTEFKERYFAELDENPQAVGKITSLLNANPIILLYSSQDRERNQAVALREYLKNKQIIALNHSA